MDRTVVEWVDELTDNSKAKETRHLQVALIHSLQVPAINSNMKPDLFSKFPQLLQTPKFGAKIDHNQFFLHPLKSIIFTYISILLLRNTIISYITDK